MLCNFEMSITQKYAQKYKISAKKEKGKILDQYCELNLCNREAAVQRLRRVYRNINPVALKINKPIAKKGPKRRYNLTHENIVKKCWELSGCICAERLHPILKDCITCLIKNKELSIYKKADLDLALKASLGTLKNIIGRFPKDGAKQRRKKAPFLYREIPIKPNFGKYSNKTGMFEVDFVEHCGSNASGRFGVTGCYVDISSQWLASSSALGKNLQAILKIHELNYSKIYHEIKEFHPDNAKPILRHLFDLATNGAKFKLSRSRPYEKNDNAHVEQKNNDKIRNLVGYYRYDDENQIELLNKLYDKSDLMDNFFIPSAKLQKKVFAKNGKLLKKIYDKPKTPYQRIISERQIPEETKYKLKEIKKKLDMLNLRKEIDKKLEDLTNTVLI